MIYAVTRMLTMRSLGWFWAVRLVGIVAITATRSYIPPAFIMPLALLLYVGVTLAFSRGPLVRRLVVASLMLVVMLVAEVIGTAYWFANTGLPVGSYDDVRAHIDVFAAMHLLHFVVLLALVSSLELLVKRVFSKTESNCGVSTVFYAIVPFLQIPFLFVALAMQRYVLPESAGLYGGNLLLFAAFLLADVALFWSLGRSRDQALANQRADVLAEELERSLATYGKVVDSLQNTSRLRHDFRNQAQVVLALAEEGRYQEAREHVADLAALVQNVHDEAPTS